MVTTFSPPARPKKQKKNLVPIALGVACAVFLVGFIVFFLKAGDADARLTAINEGVLKVAEASGSQSFTEASLSDTASASAGLTSLAAEISSKMANAERVRGELDQAQAALNLAQTELTATLSQMNDAARLLESVRGDLATRTTELNNLRQSSQAELTRQQGLIAELEARIQELAEGLGNVSETIENAVAAAPALTADDAAMETSGEAPVEEVEKPKAKKSSASVVPEGGSRTFKTVRYDARKSTLTFITVDDQVLTYKDVPESVYDALVAAPVFDVFFRFRIMDVFESNPNDRELLLTIKR